MKRAYEHGIEPENAESGKPAGQYTIQHNTIHPYQCIPSTYAVKSLYPYTLSVHPSAHHIITIILTFYHHIPTTILSTILSYTGQSGKVVSRMLNTAVSAGKRVRSETGISKGAVSISSAAAGILLAIVVVSVLSL